MKKIRFTYIRRWLLLYLVMVIFTTTTISVIFYMEVARTLKSETTKEWINRSAGASDQAVPPWSGLELVLSWLLIGGLLISSGLGYAWYRITSMKIDRPARIILRSLNQLAKGQLNETIAIDTPEEFRQIGSGINELAANLQELLLFIWKQTGQCLTLLEHIQNNPDLRHDRRLTLESLGYLKKLSESMDDLREMAKSYVFYDVSLDGDKIHAINEPGTKPHPE